MLLSMPSATLKPNMITKFTNCRLIRGDKLIEEDLWISSETGKILHSQDAFYGTGTVPDSTINLGGRIISPGLIDVQLNGAFGHDFSHVPTDLSNYGKTLRQVNRSLIETGVTSYLPTLTSQKREVYHKLLPFLGPSGRDRRPQDGSESLGAHCEGPFLNTGKNGIHAREVLTEASSFSDLLECYDVSNLLPQQNEEGDLLPPRIKKITAAPEVAQMTNLISKIQENGIIYSIGHSEASYEEAALAVSKGANMITHLYNAMKPLHHRNPGIFGVLGVTEGQKRPYFGIIADGIHVHPSAVKIAWNMHPEGFILVTDAMHLVGCKDGVYDWGEGKIVKSGSKLTLNETDTIAGSSITLLECVNNFLKWSGSTIPEAIKAVTKTPANMLGMDDIKGSLAAGADADLVIFDEVVIGGKVQLVADEVYKFGEVVYRRL